MIIRLGKPVRTTTKKILIEALQAQKVRGLGWIGKYDGPAALDTRQFRMHPGCRRRVFFFPSLFHVVYVV